MNLESSVYFRTYINTYYKPFLGDMRVKQHGSLLEARDLNGKLYEPKDFIGYLQFGFKHGVVCFREQNHKITYFVSLCRYVRIADKNDGEIVQQHSFLGGSFDFIFSSNDKLVYLDDVEKILGSSRHFSGITFVNSDVIPDVPLYVDKYDGYHAWVRPLTQKDVVVDMKLNQIWPQPTGNPPVELFNLLARTTETVR